VPEGDTVWRATRRLDQSLAGQVLTRTDFRVPELATADLSGRTVDEVVPRGKHLLMRLGGGITINSHFQMDGSWHLYRPGESWRGGPDHQVRVVLETAPWVAVGYRLPVLNLVATDAEDTVVGHLGPDLLSPSFDRSLAIANLAADPDRTISEALLDQRNLAGVGNLYKAETLFLRGVWPWTRVGQVADLDGTVRLAQKLVASNKGRWTQTTTGSLRRGETSYVYGRRAQPCRRCGAAIQKADQEDRVTYWCPRCQPRPTP
jgi:endonuclease-8